MTTRPPTVVLAPPSPPAPLDRLDRLGGDLAELEVRVRNLEAEVSEQRALTGLLIRTLTETRQAITDRH